MAPTERLKNSIDECTTQTERQQLIEHWLWCVEQNLDEKNQANDFIESLREQFDRRGDLSQKQVEALEKFYERV